MATTDTPTPRGAHGEDRGVRSTLDEIQAMLLDLQETVEEIGTTPADRLLTRDEAADLLRISKRKLDDLEEAGRLQAVRIGRRVLYHPDTLQAFIRQKSREGA